MAVNKWFLTYLYLIMRKLCRLGFTPAFIDEPVVAHVPFTTIGQRVRDAIDMGVDPNINPMPAAYDTEDDGDQVDPIADPRADLFEVAERLEGMVIDAENGSK